MRYKLPQEIGATTPTRLLGRRLGEVGAKPRVTENDITDEDFAEFMSQLRDEPNGDVSETIASYTANIEF